MSTNKKDDRIRELFYDREWEILKRQVNSIDYEDMVQKLNGELCGHCASLVRTET